MFLIILCEEYFSGFVKSVCFTVPESHHDFGNYGELSFQSSHPSPGQKYSGYTQTAYVPNTPKGREVTKLLNVAFTRRLLFTVSPSTCCRSKEGTITWNGVLHKTNITGGRK